MSMKKPKTNIEDVKKEINLSWFWYKVCEGCDNVVLYEQVFCTSCRGYRFNENRKRVIDEIVKRYEDKFKRNTDSQQLECSD